MCDHRYVQSCIQRYYDSNMQCNVEVRQTVCTRCGKTEESKAYLRDPPKGRKLPKFIHDDLCSIS